LMKKEGLVHDPEKWKPVFRQDHAPPKCMIRKSGNRFSDKIMRYQNVRAPIDSN
jgi:hypothetical protein